MSLAGLRTRWYHRAFGADTALGACIRDGDRVLDVGCSIGTGSVLLDEVGAIGVDIHRPSLEVARSSGRRPIVVQADITRLPFRPGSIDVVAALDVVEHLDSPAGRVLLHEVVATTRRDAVVLTPSGFDPQPGTPEQPYMEHRSGWTAADLRDAGFDVVGWGGPRRLRWSGQQGRFRWGPLGAGLALLLHVPTRRHPDRAFHLIGRCSVRSTAPAAVR